MTSLAVSVNKIKDTFEKWRHSAENLSSKENLVPIFKHIKSQCDVVYRDFSEQLKKAPKTKAKLDFIEQFSGDFLKKYGGQQ